MEKWVIFDIDGTLNQTELYAVEAYQKALKKRGKYIDREEIIACIGLSPDAIVEKLFGVLEEKELRLWRMDIESHEQELMMKYAKCFPGMENTLQQLKNLGYGLAICSNAYPEHIANVLNAINLYDYFDEISSLLMGRNKTEVLNKLLLRLKPQQACMVGDRIFDAQAAADNQIPFIGCAYGYAPEEVKEADAVVNDTSEIVEALNMIFGKCRQLIN